MTPQYPQRPASYQGRAGSTADLAMGHLELHGPTGEMALALAIDKELGELGALLAWPIKQGALRKEVVGDEWVYSMGDGVPLALLKPPADPPVLDTPIGLASKALAAAGQRAIDQFNGKHPSRGLTAMQARGEVMEPEACASATGRGRDAAPARAVSPHTSSPDGGPMGVEQPAAAGLTRAVGKAIAKVKRKPAPAAEPPAQEQEQEAGEEGGDDSRIRIALWSDGVLDIRRPGGHLVRFTKAESRALVDYLDSISLDPVREEIPA